MKPLTGIKVVDFSKVLAGPLCTQYLGHFGAEIVKVDAYKDGDDTRWWPPFRGQDGTVFLSANPQQAQHRARSQEAGRPRGRAQADPHGRRRRRSFGPGVAKRLGIDYDSVRSDNERLIYCSISGFGPRRPLRSGKGYDVILQAFSGMMSITGEENGPPARSPFSPVDQATGFHAVSGVLAALLERNRTGQGALIETSLFDSALAFLGYFLQGYWEKGTQPAKAGSGHESLRPYQAFEASDKFVLIGVANDALWRKFCEVAGLRDYLDDQRFRTNADRVKHRAATVELVQSAVITRSCDEWVGLMAGAGIPCAPINSFADVTSHPHTRESGMVVEYEHHAHGMLKTVAQPILFNGERNQPSSPPRCTASTRERSSPSSVIRKAPSRCCRRKRSRSRTMRGRSSRTSDDQADDRWIWQRRTAGVTPSRGDGVTHRTGQSADALLLHWRKRAEAADDLV